jgi:ABC-type bacteriocin/lantibiotic exporter with double-glycine peptidase domain
MPKKPRSPRKPKPLRIVTTGPSPYDWERIDKHPDPRTIQQETESRCTAACLQMLLWPNGGGLSQQQLAASAYLGNEPAPLARILPTLHALDPTGNWRHRFHQPNDSLVYLHAHSPWLAILLLSRPNIRSEGHAVLVIGPDAKGDLLVKDPFDATAYTMRSAHFNNRWTGLAIFRQGP